MALAGILAAAGFLLSAQVARRGPSVWIGVGFTVEKSGIRVTTLPYDSPAEKAGFLINDLIVGGDGLDFTVEPAAFDRQFREFISNHEPGDAITLKVMRD
ncbi:MAG TPA: PDZ domain-containing protein, partial [Terriglobia bacterium]|nr:PDZ domain-containing protein [Terriglobia bacterium]